MSSYIPETISPIHIAAGAGTTLSLYLLSKYWSSKSRLPYPPGPRPLPLVGNLLDIPTSRFALAWTKMAEQYGPLTFLTVPGQHLLIISSFEAAKEILEKRGSNYMDRPRFVMAGELIGFEEVTTISRYGPAWRRHRALLKQSLSPTTVRRDYSELLMKKATEYMEYLLARPENFLVDLNKVMAQNILELTYGRTSDEEGRDYIKLNSYVMEVAINAMEGYLVDSVPALQYLPSWLPGMKFKRDATRWKKEMDDVRGATFERAKKSVITGDADHVSAYMLNNLRDVYRKHDESPSADKASLKEEEMAISHTGFSFFVAGVDTSQFTIHGIILAMILFPSVQEKAQAELDRVVGKDRPPTFNDQPDLPYLQALVLEALRWSHPAPSGLTHRAMSDDIYNGYFIPKGTTVMANIWAMTRSPKTYKDPTVFNPDRHLGPSRELDPREFVFGFGRRVCPGSELALQTIWIMAASMLWAFKFEKDPSDSTPLDDDVDRFNFEFLSSPVPFKCSITPRLGADALKEKLGH